MTIAIALAAGIAIGLSLGALGGGGSILAVPVLVYGLGQTPAQATTGSLVVVGVTSVAGAVAAHRGGHLRLGSGLLFGTVAIAGATIGALLSTRVPSAALLNGFAVLLLVVAGLLIARRRRGRDTHNQEPAPAPPLLTLRPTFSCRCAGLVKVLGAGTAVGLLTGFFGVGGGFLVVPALVLALGVPMRYAAGTSLVVIAVTATAALIVRSTATSHPDWLLVALLTGASTAGGWTGARFANRVPTRRLETGFVGLLVLVAGFIGVRAVPHL